MTDTSPFNMLISNLFIIASFFATNEFDGLCLLILGFLWLGGYLFISLSEIKIRNLKFTTERLKYKIIDLRHKQIIQTLEELKGGNKKK